MTWLCVLLVVLSALWLGAIPVFIYIEKKEFNHGTCSRCGEKMRHFDVDSQGGHGWCCDRCGRVIWCSWIKEAQP